MEPRIPPRRRLWFLVPGDLNTPTGGYRYDKRVIQGLSGLGWDVQLGMLDASFPQPNPKALTQAQAALAAIPDGETVVVDGLAYGTLSEIVPLHQGRLRLVALVHHPLWLETGIDAPRAEALRRDELRALAAARRIIVTSPGTGRLLQAQGLSAQRIRVVTPGVDPAPLARSPTDPCTRLLCVATLTPRKGHDLLLEALAALTPLPWHLTCVGSLDRDPAWSAEVQRRCRALGLEGRVRFTGVLSDTELERRYAEAGLFVLPTRFEGYGMVVAEALVRGLPILATRTGALTELVPPGAGILVPPGEGGALAQALATLLGDAGLRRRLGTGSRAAGAVLPDWEQTAQSFADTCSDIPDGEDHGTTLEST